MASPATPPCNRPTNTAWVFAGGALFSLLCLAFVITVISRAWVAEDAYITFRVIDNFLHGYGLRWNIDERVQVYTHPLWMLLHIPLQALTQHIILTTLIIGTLCMLAALALPIAAAGFSIPRLILCLAVMPLASTTFRDFVNCGLEIPLTWATAGAFFYQLTRHPKHPHRLHCAAAFCILTRFDNALFLLPALLWQSYQHRKQLRILRLILAWSPLLLWCLFSLMYYGFLFPNTKYAKLSTGLSNQWYIDHGMAYFRNFMHYDPTAFLGISAVILICAWKLFRTRDETYKTLPHHTPLYLIAAGMLLHGLYIISIGGDFMSGRFFAPIFYLSLWFFYLWTSQHRNHLLLLALALPLVYFYGPRYFPPLQNDTNFFMNDGIVNERAYYESSNNSFIRNASTISLRQHPSHIFVSWGMMAASTPSLQGVAVTSNIGMYGYYAGPRLRVIDSLALSDPLLARLPVMNSGMRIGHFYRNIPAYYVESRRNGAYHRMPTPVAAYYAPLRLITSGNVWDIERLKTIVKFNLGFYPVPTVY